MENGKRTERTFGFPGYLTEFTKFRDFSDYWPKWEKRVLLGVLFPFHVRKKIIDSSSAYCKGLSK
jgi:hypothetical protein